jgi:hypothetical protein
VYSRLREACAFAPLVALTITCFGCDAFYDEGSRFASQVADFAETFHKSPQSTAVFDYVPRYGINQRVYVGIGRINWCPHPPCDNQGAATFHVERGRSGTGYRIPAAACVPASLEIHKESRLIHVHMRKVNGVVEIVALD